MDEHESGSGGRRGLRQRLFARMYASGSPTDADPQIQAHKRAIFAGISGDVLEIGPGAGDNLSYFPKDVRWIGVEPNLFMQRHLQKALEHAGIHGEIRTGTAERLPVADASMDVVVSTYVLCSVIDLEGTLREVLRVLRPGGRFVYMEHVAAPSGTISHIAQKAIKPVWKLAADGCNPDRDIEASLRQAGFAHVDVTHFRLPVPIVSPQIAGIAVKAGGE